MEVKDDIKLMKVFSCGRGWLVFNKPASLSPLTYRLTFPSFTCIRYVHVTKFSQREHEKEWCMPLPLTNLQWYYSLSFLSPTAGQIAAEVPEGLPVTLENGWAVRWEDAQPGNHHSVDTSTPSVEHSKLTIRTEKEASIAFHPWELGLFLTATFLSSVLLSLCCFSWNVLHVHLVGWFVSKPNGQYHWDFIML